VAKPLPLIVLVVCLAGCKPLAAVMPSPTLPAPIVHALTPTLTATPQQFVPTPTLASDLAELARQTYGDRLPETITIPALNILSAIRPAGWQMDPYDPETMVWDSPEAEVGWSVTSALPDVAGNIILYGHNNINSSIFKYLYNLKEGDEIHLTTGQADFPYVVSRVEILEVSNDDANQEAYLQYFKATRAPRLTLLSCYPPDNNTHRVIVIAYPVGP
jgi:LPXTG-site transpeptidase (sortase) family protein